CPSASCTRPGPTGCSAARSVLRSDTIDDCMATPRRSPKGEGGRVHQNICLIREAMVGTPACACGYGDLSPPYRPRRLIYQVRMAHPAPMLANAYICCCQRALT